MRKRIEQAAGITAFDIYGLTEIIGPGVGAECFAQNGLHLFEDHFYPEIIDPDTCEPLPDGQEGELVLTTLSKQAMPILRYRTRDITSLVTEPCVCGRTIRRMRRISHRSDDIDHHSRRERLPRRRFEAALLAVEGALPHYQIFLTRQKGARPHGSADRGHGRFDERPRRRFGIASGEDLASDRTHAGPPCESNPGRTPHAASQRRKSEASR